MYAVKAFLEMAGMSFFSGLTKRQGFSASAVEQVLFQREMIR
jgi:hypothetical protein